MLADEPRSHLDASYAAAQLATCNMRSSTCRAHSTTQCAGRNPQFSVCGAM